MSRKHIYNELQLVAIMNHCFIAYFLNILDSEGVDICNMRPTCGPTKDMVGRYFMPNQEYAYMKEFYSDRVIIDNKELSEMNEMGLEDFFDKSFRDEIKKSAKAFASAIKKYPYPDLIFSLLPDEPPFPTICETDCDTGFVSRAMFGKRIDVSKGTFMFDFYCLIITRYREADETPAYGRVLMPVENMTEEQRAKFDKQPEKKDEDF